jgi:cytoskeletal protein RodZ
VKEQVAALTIDRDLLEKESARRIFEKVVSWIKLASALIVLAIVVIGGVVIWQFSDWRSAIAKAERAIADEANSVKNSAAQTGAQISQQTDSLKNDIARSRQQLQAAAQLEPQM